MTNSTETVDERIARRDREKSAFREQLAGQKFDGPHEIQSGGGFDPMPAIFGGGPTCYAICLRCAAMVRLNDAEESNGKLIERSIRIHIEWHEEAGA